MNLSFYYFELLIIGLVIVELSSFQSTRDFRNEFCLNAIEQFCSFGTDHSVHVVKVIIEKNR